MRDHGHSQKWTMYDVITRVPMIVWSPGRIEGERRLNGLCQQMDIVPFILEAAGVDVPEYFEALSLRLTIEGAPWAGR
ncbi:MAG: sulfatase/phosphatase domain-containing protein, partial [Candidatus Latescibacterota bacterium]|nr:sulfatase/phosphatase domain-containing protein [Candidatus Latescibacterota bacterium]